MVAPPPALPAECPLLRDSTALHLGHDACTQPGNSPDSKRGSPWAPHLSPVCWPSLADVQCLGDGCFIYCVWVFNKCIQAVLGTPVTQHSVEHTNQAVLIHSPQMITGYRLPLHKQPCDEQPPCIPSRTLVSCPGSDLVPEAQRRRVPCRVRLPLSTMWQLPSPPFSLLHFYYSEDVRSCLVIILFLLLLASLRVPSYTCQALGFPFELPI